MARAVALNLLGIGVLSAALSFTAGAQAPERIRFELRLDGLAKAREMPATLHAGAGIARRFGMTQLALLAGAGPSREGLTGRFEGAVRFHVDPFRERRWGLYGAAGGGALWSDSTSAYLLLLAGLEGRRSPGGWSPFVEAGLSRGARVALGIRHGPGSRR